ncbi:MULTISPECIES: hypothetical protein [unclassified Mycoplasma]|uniref:hypothetical protein n=1 Tax=unclassified Mycoplasma TaxID=2683645 RepID=UPI002B1E430B|nr:MULTISPECIES: hypothetical protein [unclassified Mycoplasma]MEA4191297.1 hypothetical protein [Mycoplasma sp. 2248]MEA4206445.1 hypothetical protein [Mycoplasma sp. 1199]
MLKWNLRDFLKYRKADELYEKGQKTFASWVWLLFASITLIAALTLAGFLIVTIGHNTFLKPDTTNLSSDDVIKVINESKSLFIFYIINQIFYIIIFCAAAIVIIISFIKVRKEKTYLNFNRWPILLSTIVGLFSVFTLFKYIFNGTFNQPGLPNIVIAIVVIDVVTTILTIVNWLIPAKKVVFIIKMFYSIKMEEETLAMAAKMQELFKNNPNGISDLFSGFANGANLNDIFKNQNKAADATDSEKKDLSEEEKIQADVQKETAIKKLLEIPNEQLFKMAELLGISGYQEMPKDKLAELIFNYTKQANEEHNKENA